MRLKNFLYKLYFLIFFLFVFNDFVFAYSILKINKNILFYQKNNLRAKFYKNNIRKFIFLKQNECFSFVKMKNFSLNKEEFIISNNNFIGVFKKNKFKMFYVVKSKDTLYSIGKKSGHSYYELSKFNFIKKPYKIFVGQKIWIGNFLIDKNKYSCSIAKRNEKKTKNIISCKFLFENSLNMSNFLKNELNNYDTKSMKLCFLNNKDFKKNNSRLKIQSSIFSKNWNWPVNTKNIQYFYNVKSKNKEMEISGFKGQPIFSVADGKVVFVTDLFEKYGRLIIIKHDEDYLSIYAFNDLILVKLGDKVRANQKISTMGLSEKKLVRLYFEIRYRGESVNPLSILPKINKKNNFY